MISLQKALLILQLYLNYSTSSAQTINEGGAILVLGDSWASASGDFLTGVCGLVENGTESNEREVTNNGKSGSTAKQWVSNGVVQQSFSNTQNQFDHVWLSIGGNDFLGNNCDDGVNDEITGDIEQVVGDIFNASTNDELKILMTGYGYPSEDVCGNGRTISQFDKLNSSIQEAMNKIDRVTYVDVSSEFVTSESSPYSDKEWYADSIHINREGYIKLFSMQPIQEFFECSIGTSSSPSSAPSTTSSPTHQIALCDDSSVRFKFKKNGKKITRSCEWVARIDTINRCALDGVSSMCPYTCGACNPCIDGTARFKLVYNDKKITRKCEWVANKQTAQRCAADGVSGVCRSTCNSC